MITPERFKEIRSLFVDISDKLSEDELNAISDLLECSSDVIEIANTRSAPARCDGLVRYDPNNKTYPYFEMEVGELGEYVRYDQAAAMLDDKDEMIMRIDRFAKKYLRHMWNAQQRAEAAEAELAEKDEEFNKLEDAWYEAEGKISDLEADNKRLREALSIFLGDATMECLLWGDAKSTDLVTIRVQKQKYDSARAALGEMKL